MLKLKNSSKDRGFKETESQNVTQRREKDWRANMCRWPTQDKRD